MKIHYKTKQIYGSILLYIVLCLGINYNAKAQNFSDISIKISDPFQESNPTVLSASIKYWNGTIWEGGEPDANSDAVISQNYNGAGFAAKDLVVSNGKSLIASSDIEIYGNVDNQSRNTISGTVLLKGLNAQTFKGKIQNLTLNNVRGASLAGLTELTGTLKLEAGTLVTNRNLILISNASGTARIAKIEPLAFLDGDVNVQRFVPGSTAGWHFIGTSVLGQTQANWSDNFQLTNRFLFVNNEAGTINSGDQKNGWEYAPSTIEIGKGYRAFLNQGFFNAGAVYDNTGPIFTGPKTFPITYTSTGYNGGGWNFISNPYPCEIDWHILSKSSIDGQIHIWNPETANYGSYTQGTGISTFGVNRYIPSGQSFFVKASSPGASLTIDEFAKPEIPADNSFLRIATDPSNVARFTLRGPSGKTDEAAVRWMDESTKNFDAYYDANELYSTGQINLYTRTEEGTKVAIQARPFYESDSIYISYDVSEPGSYFLQGKISPDIFEGKTWFIKDLSNGIMQEIQEEFLLPFNVENDVLNPSSRFRLVAYEPVIASRLNYSDPIFKLYPNPAVDQFEIEGASEVAKVSVSDLNGRLLLEQMNDGNKHISIATEALETGIYIVKIQTTKAVQTHKLVKE